MEKINGYIIYWQIRYEIQEQKEVPVWYAGIYCPISRTDFILNSLYWRAFNCYTCAIILYLWYNLYSENSLINARDILVIPDDDC
jgi:hypothetical protein